MQTRNEQLFISIYRKEISVDAAISKRVLKINEVDCNGNSHLYYAITCCRYGFDRAPEIVEKLIAAGENIDQLYAPDRSILELALGYRLNKVVDLLIAKGAKITGPQGENFLSELVRQVRKGETYYRRLANTLVRGGLNPDYNVWYFDTRRHYKIWFSKYPDAFMDMENQLRLVCLKANNPSMILTLIYSSACLTTKARDELLQFCKDNQINPVDFNTELKDLLVHPNDLALYEIALNEINYTIEANGGNMAAASDCVRLLLAVIANYGMYHDFEKQLNVEALPPLIRCLTPIIKNGFGNDTIAVAVDPNDVTKINDTAAAVIKKSQEIVLANYKTYGEVIVDSLKNRQGLLPFYSKLVNAFIQSFPDSTVFSFRKFFQNADSSELLQMLSDSDTVEFNRHSLQTIRDNMLDISIVPISGFALYTAVVKDLRQYLIFSQREDNFGEMYVADNTKEHDCSWKSAGELEKKSRSAEVAKGILFFQKTILGHNVRNQLKQEIPHAVLKKLFLELLKQSERKCRRTCQNAYDQERHFMIGYHPEINEKKVRIKNAKERVLLESAVMRDGEETFFYNYVFGLCKLEFGFLFMQMFTAKLNKHWLPLAIEYGLATGSGSHLTCSS